MSRVLSLHSLRSILPHVVKNEPLAASLLIPNSDTNRCQRNIFLFSNAGTRKKEYTRRELVGYSMEQMFDVVWDVENYNKFVPFCKKSQILTKSANGVKADLVIGFPPVNEQYTSSVTMSKPQFVRAECHDGRLFSYLLNVWRFSPGLDSNPQSCVIDFHVSFKFKSAIHSNLANLFFDKVVVQIGGAFLKEAGRRYGRPSLRTRELMINDTAKV